MQHTIIFVPTQVYAPLKIDTIMASLRFLDVPVFFPFTLRDC
jgi:hypothetical protein